MDFLAVRTHFEIGGIGGQTRQLSTLDDERRKGLDVGVEGQSAVGAARLLPSRRSLLLTAGGHLLVKLLPFGKHFPERIFLRLSPEHKTLLGVLVVVVEVFGRTGADDGGKCSLVFGLNVQRRSRQRPRTQDLAGTHRLDGVHLHVERGRGQALSVNQHILGIRSIK